MRGELQWEHHHIQRDLLRKNRLDDNFYQWYQQNPADKELKHSQTYRHLLVVSWWPPQIHQTWKETMSESNTMLNIKDNSWEEEKSNALPLSTDTYLNWKLSTKLFYVANHLAFLHYLLLLCKNSKIRRIS